MGLGRPGQPIKEVANYVFIRTSKSTDVEGTSDSQTQAS